MSTERRALTGVTSMAARRILDEVARDFAATHGVDVSFAAMGGVEAARRMREGSGADLVALASAALDALGREGRLAAGLRVDYAASGIAVAVRAGAESPDLSSESAVRAAMLRARRIAYSTGPSGDHVRGLWRRWGLEEAMAERAVQAPPGVPVAGLVASGEADLGLQQESELIGAPGIAIAGPLPPGLQLTTVFSAAAAADCSDPASAQAFLAYLASPQAEAAIRRQGMAPV